jgi:hypothetical protein
MSKINGYTSFTDIKKTIKTSSVGLYSGSTSVVKLGSVFIPANTFNSNEIIEIEAIIQKSGITTSSNITLYWNSSDTITSATLLATNTYDITWDPISISRNIAIRTQNGTSQGSLVNNATSTIGTDYTVFTASMSVVSLNWTINSYILVGGFTPTTINNLRCITLKISN